ncbi:MAG: ATP-binding cassette domain-containing protein [Bacillota bacterium]|nr:ATP-binding cassette domain-containing protein [Bacillota bacterium]
MLKINDLSKKLGNFSLKDINMEIKKGEYLVILGPTGTGKTVILELIAGRYQPDKGSIIFKNENLLDKNIENRNIGFVYQDYVLFPHLTVKENIEFGAKIKKINIEEINTKLKYFVDIFNIKHLLERFPNTLSGGEQQRVAIARALIVSPELFLLDEPLSALDPHTKTMFQTLLKEIHIDMKTTTIHITHDFNEALYLADKIAVVNNGEVVQFGTPKEIFEKPNSLFVANFIGANNVLKDNVV